MQVIATAGHVDHGKSTLVRALTGVDPDRWAEERRRGMTIDLGFAWTGLPSGERVAFVDVPGHVRFVGNMLAGVGPVPAVMFVLAADQGWQAQSQEHWEAIEAFGVRHGLLVVTRTDLMDPEPALAEAREHTTWPAVTVSGRTGEGLDRLRHALDRLVAGLPPPDVHAPVRLWIDRAFTITGAGTVVTGTLAAGTLRAGDVLDLGGERVRVKALQTLGEPAGRVEATARVAVNLRGVDRDRVARGMTLLTPGAWVETGTVDVRHGAGERPPREAVLHIGSAAVPVRIRPFAPGTARLTLARPLPLRIGDRALLRCPGRPIAGVVVLDVHPPVLRRGGAGRRRAAQLAPYAADPDGPGGPRLPDAATVLSWRGVARRAELAASGCDLAGLQAPGADGWLADPELWACLAGRLGELAAAEPGLPVDAARAALGLPCRGLVEALVRARPPLRVEGGRIVGTGLPAPVAAAVERLRRELAAAPYRAPEADDLARLGLDARAIALAARAGLLLRLRDGVVLPAGADTAAARLLARLPQPFTAAEARTALGTSRRVVIPLLEHLDTLGLTRRLDDRLRVVATPDTSAGDTARDPAAAGAASRRGAPTASGTARRSLP
ncbi:selenocysteine-specific translation elongation factor [Thermopolyspora flexuosa]|uniref:Selenocysteine-specific elongation factor n=1 Tax=Thermopolyspora flexuosa TaxID=103836 RepID=A0A543IY21_9ACTN|nr:selenocysteine-specific translation elongation factor [Thermopolyspora flexuosa]TQM75466.1 selenocysteine-specific elongation factor [Thermopolyspora flexuosa]GGM59585.1 selenocysteine-specific translation elongation factor [Thermopolyspora flexuosa]